MRACGVWLIAWMVWCGAGCVKDARECSQRSECFAGEVCADGACVPGGEADMASDMRAGEIAGASEGDAETRACPATSAEGCADGACCAELPPPRAILPLLDADARPELIGVAVDQADRVVVVYLDRTTGAIRAWRWAGGRWVDQLVAQLDAAEGLPSRAQVAMRAYGEGAQVAYIDADGTLMAVRWAEGGWFPPTVVRTAEAGHRFTALTLATGASDAREVYLVAWDSEGHRIWPYRRLYGSVSWRILSYSDPIEAITRREDGTPKGSPDVVRWVRAAFDGVGNMLVSLRAKPAGGTVYTALHTFRFRAGRTTFEPRPSNMIESAEAPALVHGFGLVTGGTQYVQLTSTLDQLLMISSLVYGEEPYPWKGPFVLDEEPGASSPGFAVAPGDTTGEVFIWYLRAGGGGTREVRLSKTSEATGRDWARLGVLTTFGEALGGVPASVDDEERRVLDAALDAQGVWHLGFSDGVRLRYRRMVAP